MRDEILLSRPLKSKIVEVLTLLIAAIGMLVLGYYLIVEILRSDDYWFLLLISIPLLFFLYKTLNDIFKAVFEYEAIRVIPGKLILVTVRNLSRKEKVYELNQIGNIRYLDNDTTSYFEGLYQQEKEYDYPHEGNNFSSKRTKKFVEKKSFSTSSNNGKIAFDYLEKTFTFGADLYLYEYESIINQLEKQSGIDLSMLKITSPHNTHNK